MKIGDQLASWQQIRTQNLVIALILLLILILPMVVVSHQNVIAAPASQYTPPSWITVTMFRLEQDGTNTYVPCSFRDTAFGCTADSNYPYPHATNIATVPIETDYLLDVVPQETPPDDYHSTAVQAEAIAARTYAYWHIRNGSTINNSTDFQVFVPYKFENLYTPNFPDNPSNPCASSNLNTNQRNTCAAVAPQDYLSSSSNDLPAFVQYFDDVLNRTETDTGTLHLRAVDDPISTGCGATNSIGHHYGLSQHGASRWARGSLCAFAAQGHDPWSVRWDRVEQILVHYYTGVHLRDANTTILTPDYRWNPLRINWGTPDNRPPILYHGSPWTIDVQVQNTGVSDWVASYPYYYYLRYRWAKVGFGESTSSYQATATGTTKGDPSPTLTLTLGDIPAWGPGAYTIRLDIYVTSASGNFWFSDLGWPSYDVPVCVDGPCLAFIPLALKDYTARTDTYEPNDNFAQAWQIYAGGVYDSYVWYAGDNDYYKFILSRGVVQIQLTNIPAGCNYDLYLYDAGGTELTKSVNPGQTDEQVTWSVSTGSTYYVRVRPAYGYSQSNPYRLRLNWWPGLKGPPTSPSPYPGPG